MNGPIIFLAISPTAMPGTWTHRGLVIEISSRGTATDRPRVRVAVMTTSEKAHVNSLLTNGNTLTWASTVRAVLTYYSDRTVEVTSQALNIHGHVFLLSDLGDVWHSESEPKPNGARRKGREIWAVWRGKELMLLRVTDRTRFGQIYRAIQRTLEQHPT